MKKILKPYLLALALLLTITTVSGCSQPKKEEAKPKEEQKAPATYEDITDSEKESVPVNEKDNVIRDESLVDSKPTVIENEQQKIGANSKRFVKATVIKNTDGDTFKVRLADGKEESVRFLLVDTPETKHPKLGVQPFGPEASAFTKKYAPVGKEITLELDVSDREKYGRLLAYVWVDGQLLNRMLVEQGLARVAYIYAPNTKYVDYLKEAQTKAQQAKRGIWSVENYATDKGFDANKAPTSTNPTPPAPTPTPAPAPTPTPGKENISFKSCKDANAAGYYNLKKGEPGYSEKLDGDKDGVACEKK